MGFRDIGAWTYVFLFGAIYGAAASWIYSRKFNSKDNPNNRASYSSNTLAFLSTFFLWIYFPSFNSFNYAHNDFNYIHNDW